MTLAPAPTPLSRNLAAFCRSPRRKRPRRPSYGRPPRPIRNPSSEYHVSFGCGWSTIPREGFWCAVPTTQQVKAELRTETTFPACLLDPTSASPVDGVPPYSIIPYRTLDICRRLDLVTYHCTVQSRFTANRAVSYRTVKYHAEPYGTYHARRYHIPANSSS